MKCNKITKSNYEKEIKNDIIIHAALIYVNILFHWTGFMENIEVISWECFYWGIILFIWKPDFFKIGVSRASGSKFSINF